MVKELEKRFTEEDINNVATLTFRAVKLIKKPYDYPEEWMSDIIEQLEPYSFDENVAEKLRDYLKAEYKKLYGRENYFLQKE